MSIRSEIDRITGLVIESHQKARTKGGSTTAPSLANLPKVIDSIPQGLAVLTDRTTGTQYTLYVEDGELKMEETAKIADMSSIKTPELYVDSGKLMMEEG